MKNLLNKTLEKGPLNEIIRKMLKHFEEHNFLVPQGKEIGLGFNGSLLLKHIRNEWLLTNLYHSDEPSFSVQDTMEREFTRVSNLVEKLPFSLVTLTQKVDEKKNSDKDLLLNFQPTKFTVMKKDIFCYPSVSTSFFHKQQRERKIWWRKFSSLPGRFAMTEISTEENGTASVDITADFPWGAESVESVRCQPGPSHLQVKDGRKTVPAHLVISETKLEVATLAYICDAYDALNEETDRHMMRFHRKLAPFKITFAASATSANVSKQLSDLALVLARKIRKSGIPCLLLPDMAKIGLENHFLRSDAMGIPYTIVLNDRTLTDGIIGIRSRDTTLKEQSHVGIVVPYVEQLMKNY